MSTQEEVEVSYDVSNEFFELWLDKKMNYTCALFDGTDDLEEAQVKKLNRLSRFAGIDENTQSVLDIGCGWGANMEHQSEVNNVPDVHGITLSSAQLVFVSKVGKRTSIMSPTKGRNAGISNQHHGSSSHEEKLTRVHSRSRWANESFSNRFYAPSMCGGLCDRRVFEG